LVMGTKIVSCSCRSEFQDQRYGAGKRVANLKEDGGTRCTVCNQEALSPRSLVKAVSAVEDGRGQGKKGKGKGK